MQMFVITTPSITLYYFSSVKQILNTYNKIYCDLLKLNSHYLTNQCTLNSHCVLNHAVRNYELFYTFQMN